MKSNNWINIRKKLPVHETDVDIWTIFDNRFCDCMYVDCSKYNEWETEKHFYHERTDTIFKMKQITHWMPLPDSPIKKAGDKMDDKTFNLINKVIEDLEKKIETIKIDILELNRDISHALNTVNKQDMDNMAWNGVQGWLSSAKQIIDKLI